MRRKLLADYLGEARAAWSPGMVVTPAVVVAFGEAEARETVNPRFGQIAKVSSSKAAATRKVVASSTPSS